MRGEKGNTNRRGKSRAAYLGGFFNIDGRELTSVCGAVRCGGGADHAVKICFPNT